MNDHDRLSELFLRACELTRDDRPAFLDAACAGNAELRAAVEAMLTHDAREGGTDAMAGLVRDAAGPAVSIPERIGPYRILRRLGEGGMGVVYLAEQTEPIRREVALKVTRWGTDSAGAVARFEAERQMLASMDHPNIARMLDAGSDADGRPYFVMERVQGLPITDYARSRNLRPRERLRLFLDVCRGVRHAHRRGVIHRDLKPSNVLVTEFGGTPAPKVIDFSIAKALDTPALTTEFRTRTGQVIGTLEYMSPEQARGDVAAVDTRADVWALGVILHELVADRLPHDLTGQPLHEAVRRICEEPARSLRTTRTTTAGRTDGDVITIVGKCLEKDPDRRYGSAAELVEDLERHLGSRPILARPPSTVYALRKLVRRHRVAFGFAALTFVFLVGYGVTVSFELGVQRREREATQRSADEARRSAARAERINAFLQDLLSSADPGHMGRNVTVREVLDRAAERLDSTLDDNPEARADAHHTLAATYGGLGDMDACARHQEKALELRRALHPGDDESVARELVALAVAYAIMPGRGADAYRLGREGIAMWRRVAAGPQPDLAYGLANLAWRLSGTMSDADRERQAREAVAMWDAVEQPDDARMGNSLNMLALILRQRGKLSEAEATSRRAVSTLERTPGPASALAVNARGDLGVIETDIPGRDEEAFALLHDTLEQGRAIYGPDHVLTGCYHRNLGFWMLKHYRLVEARREFEDAQRIFRQTYGDHHRELATAANNLAAIPHVLGEYAAALRLYGEMMSQYDRVGVPPLAAHAYHLALLLHAVGRDAESERLLRATLDRERQEGAPVTHTAALLLTMLGCIEMDSGRLREAEEHLTPVHEGLAAVEDEEGCLPPLNAVVLARLRAMQGRAAESAALFREVSDRLSYCTPRAAMEWRHLLPVTADFLDRRGDPDEGARYREALARLDRIARGEIPDWWKEQQPTVAGHGARRYESE